jgi:murein L,D-transpeptidase YcbB/YkuD
MHLRHTGYWLFGAVVILTGTSVVDARRQDDRNAQIAQSVQQIVASGKPLAHVPAPVWADVKAFYGQRAGAPAWTADKNLRKLDQALQLLRAAPDDGLVTAHYGEASFTQSIALFKDAGKYAQPSRLADLDVRLTASVLSLGRDVAIGRSTPEGTDPRWKNQRTVPNFAQTLNASIDGDLKAWVASLRPKHPEYGHLQKALADLYAIQKKGAWPRVAAKALKPGASGPPVDAMRQRLAATGFLKTTEPAPPSGGQPQTGQSQAPAVTYDEDVKTAVKAFQDHHGLAPTGVADAATIAAMNVPIGARIVQLASNLERWRWVPDDLGARHILINIPSYRLFARENGKTALTMKVVVGKADGRHHTPVFSAPMTSVIFSPHWNIPDSIVEGETVPSLAKDPNFLAKNNIEILRSTKDGTSAVDPSAVDWGNPDELKRLAFRQKPGPGNALGHVKFHLENPFDIYMHDTPADSLFARAGRAFSHGCVRLEEPEAMAKYVLRDFPEWDDAQIRAAEHSGVEKAVKLKEPIPVHIVYFTAWVDEGGGVHLLPDVYRLDRR